MLKLGRVTNVEVLFLALVFVFDIYKILAAILEKGLLSPCPHISGYFNFLFLDTASFHMHTVNLYVF